MTGTTGLLDDLPKSIEDFLDDCEELERGLCDALVASLSHNQPMLTDQIQAHLKQLSFKYSTASSEMDLITEQLCWETLAELGTKAEVVAQDKHGTEILHRFSLLYLPVSYQGKHSNLELTSQASEIEKLPRQLGLLSDSQFLLVSPFALPLTTATDTSLRIKLLEVLAKQFLGYSPDISILCTGHDYAEHPDLEMTMRTAYLPVLLVENIRPGDTPSEVDSIAEMETNPDLYEKITALFSALDNVVPITSPVVVPVAIESTLAFQALTLTRLYKELAENQDDTCNMDVVYNEDGVTLSLRNSVGEYIEANNIAVPTVAIAETVMGTIRNTAEAND